MSILFWFFLVVAIMFIGYRVAVAVIQRWTGCSTEEAEIRVNRLANSLFEKPLPPIEEDTSLSFDLWNNVRTIIGEVRYKQLQDLAYSGECIYRFGNSGGISCLEMSIFITDENEKTRIGSLARNTMQKHLIVRDYSDIVDIEWFKRDDLAMDVLRIYYAASAEENRRLIKRLNIKSKDISKKNSDISDDDEDDDKYVK